MPLGISVKDPVKYSDLEIALGEIQKHASALQSAQKTLNALAQKFKQRASLTQKEMEKLNALRAKGNQTVTQSMESDIREEILDRLFETDTIPGGRYPSSVTAGLILKVLKYLEKQDRTHPGNQRGVPTKMQSIERQLTQIDDQIKKLTGDPANVTSQGAFDKNMDAIGQLIDKKHALEKEVLAVSQAVFLNKLEKQIQTNSVQEDHYDEPASDYEGEMLDNQVAFIKYAADEICNHVHKGGVFPEWFQNKFSGVHEKIKTLHAYMEGERQQAKEKERMVSMKDAKDDYFESLERKLNESKGLCKECGKPSWKTLDEEKQKGVDGKVCWKGYKRMGTKKKGGKTVDNCVKM